MDRDQAFEKYSSDTYSMEEVSCKSLTRNVETQLSI
ncbi:uncharacterized protein G2W53_041926 [Senna tora]|uniref:Uncharacterized protein n=1 Tax=Senna tora TaxID=362788 RepID=A0A834SHW1_9FABA|nr:uncharacterized protein G2W53_041926 [Senna tora]